MSDIAPLKQSSSFNKEYNSIDPIASQPSTPPEINTKMAENTSLNNTATQDFSFNAENNDYNGNDNDKDNVTTAFSQIEMRNSSPEKTRNLHSTMLNSPPPMATQVSVSRSTYIFVFCAAMNSCNLGFDVGVNTGAGRLLQNEDSLNLSEVQLEFFMGSLNLFAAIGAISASSISDRYGRRGAFLVAAVGFIFGVLIQATAWSYTILMFGRLLVGLGVGFGLAIDPIYISEISPAEHRGRLVTWSEIATNVGIVLGFSSGLFFHNVEADTAWRLMFSMGLILPCVLIFMVIKVMPESPRWLISKGRDDEAKLVLEKVYPVGSDIDAVTKEIKTAIRREIEAEKAVGWDMIFFPSPAFRRMIIVGIGSAVSQQLVGIDAIQYFLDFILEEAGVDEGVKRTFVLIGLGILKLIVILYAGQAFDKNGRRPLMFISLLGITVSVFILSATFLFEQLNATAGIIGLALYLSSFSIGMGPGAWLIPAEVFSTVIRAKAMSLATFMNRATATLVTSTFFTLAELLTWSGFFLLLGLVNILILAFFYFYLPETKGLSLEDMSIYFAEITGDDSILEAERKLRSAREESESNTNPTHTMGTLA